MRPCVLGKDLLRIEKSGLVQYVSRKQFPSASLFSILLDSKIFWIVQMILKTVCAFLAFVLELFGVYGDGEFKWHYGYVLFSVQTCTCFIIMWS